MKEKERKRGKGKEIRRHVGSRFKVWQVHACLKMLRKKYSTVIYFLLQGFTRIKACSVA